MTGLPASLSIAFWLVGSIWLVAILADAFDAPGEIVYATFIVGLLTGLAEWLAITHGDKGIRVSVLAPQAVLRLFEVTKMDSTFPILGTREEALQRARGE